VLIVSCAVPVKIGQAQTWAACHALLTARVTRGAGMTRAQSDSVFQILNSFDRVTWEFLRNWDQTHGKSTIGFPPGALAGLAEDVHTRIRQSPRYQWIAAAALAEMIRGEFGGQSSDQALIAASLYRNWDLPVGPAESLLADPQTSFRARSLAVAALKRHWGDRGFYQAAVGALCILAAQIDGLAELTDSSDADLITDEAQLEFMGAVVSALETGYETQGGIPRVDGILPPGNPVTTYVQRRFCTALSCREAN